MAAFADHGAWTQWIDLAKSADYLAVAQKHGARLKKSGTAEFTGPCPRCGGDDRFSINVKKRLCNCRGCDLKGDVIDFIQGVTGCGKLEAIELITGIPRPDRSRDETLEQKASRLAQVAKDNARYRLRQEEQQAAEAAKAKRDEEAILKVVDRADKLAGTHGEAYLRARGLNPLPRLTGDIRFVPDLDYWGAKDNGTRAIIHLATLPAIVALIRDFSGAVIGISQTYLDPKEPRKWRPEGSPTNSPKKIRGDKKGGMIWLGPKGPTVAIGEGWENVLAFHQLGHGPEDMALAAAVDLGNLAGGATGVVGHPALTDGDGRQVRIKNAIPDMDRPGLILPPGVKSIIILADLDSETYSTAAHIRTAGLRFRAMDIDVEIAWPDRERDWNDILIAEGEHGRANGAGASL